MSLGKYFKRLIGSEQPAPVAAEPAAPVMPEAAPKAPPSGEPLAEIVPALDKGLPQGSMIDTEVEVAGKPSTSLLKVQTHGERNTTDSLRQKFFRRDPVLNQYHQVIGYRLSLRSALSDENQADPVLQTMRGEMLVQGLFSLGLLELAKDKQLIIDLPPAMWGNQQIMRLPRKNMVFMLSWLGEVGKEQMDQVPALLDAGYALGMDFMVALRDGRELGRHMTYFTVDMATLPAGLRPEKLRGLFTRPTQKMLAENVNSDEALEAAKALGCHWYQGYYFARRQPLLPPRLDGNRQRILMLLNLVRQRAEISELEEHFKRDAALSYRLLRYINSPGTGLIQTVRSIAHALIILGYDQLYRWLTLLLYASGKGDPRSQALLKSALVRARLAETVAKRSLPPAESDAVFITGIFSLLDVLFNAPMEKAVDGLSLPEPVLNALVKDEGLYAPFLRLAAACEEGEETAIITQSNALGLSADEVNELHMAALVWAESMDQDA